MSDMFWNSWFSLTGPQVQTITVSTTECGRFMVTDIFEVNESKKKINLFVSNTVLYYLT
jgi:hypothetical protein